MNSSVCDCEDVKWWSGGRRVDLEALHYPLVLHALLAAPASYFPAPPTPPSPEEKVLLCQKHKNKT